MTIDGLGRLYVWALVAYFTVSGFSSLLDINSKLARIGLRAETEDGRIAFILIYCSLMVGVGVAMGVVYLASKSWLYPALIAVTVISCFIVFRIVGAFMGSGLSKTQATFIVVEVVEVLLEVLLILRSAPKGPFPG